MYVVTGGCGFIGSNLVKYLNKKGITEITIVDDLTDGRKLATLKDLKFAAYYDCNSIDWGELGMHWIEKVFHIGAISSTTETNGKKLMEYNYKHTLMWAKYCNMGGTPFVYTSSASVYGNTNSFCETDEHKPINAYAISKSLTEQALINSNVKNAWIFRPFNVYGQGELHKDDQMSPVSKFALQKQKDGAATLFYGSDKIQRDFICVDDVVTILADYTNNNPGIYNLGTGESTSFLDIANLFTDNIHWIEMPEILHGKYQYFSKANTDKLRSKLIGDYKFITPKEYYDNIKRINAAQP